VKQEEVRSRGLFRSPAAGGELRPFVPKGTEARGTSRGPAPGASTYVMRDVESRDSTGNAPANPR